VELNADIFSANGTLIARIENGEFHLTEGQFAYPKRSEDRSTLAVYDLAGEEVLWVRWINPAVIDIRGTFSCPRHSPLLITSARMTFPTPKLSRSCFKVQPQTQWGLIVE